MTTLSPTPCNPAPYDPAPQSEGYTVVTVLLLILGGFVVPVLGWLAGVIMLWAGPRWSATSKWLGTLAWPAVVVVPLLAMVAAGVLGGDGHGGVIIAGLVAGAVIALVGLPWTFAHLLRAARPQ